MKKIPYPKKHGGQTIYVKVPEQVDNKWFVVCVTENGKTIPLPVYNPFNTRRICQTSCDQHNTFNNWDKYTVDIILKRTGYVEKN